MIYEIHHILNCGCEIIQAMILAVVNAIFAIAYGSLKNSGLQLGFEPMTSHRYRGHGFKPRWSPEFFRLPYAIAKIASTAARIIAYLTDLFNYTCLFIVLDFKFAYLLVMFPKTGILTIQSNLDYPHFSIIRTFSWVPIFSWILIM